MAYFSNGTEGALYQEQYCFKCEHWPEGEDECCPVWSEHLCWNYEREKNPAVKSILDALIPMKPHVFKDGLSYDIAAECRLFLRKQERLPL